MKTKHTPGPWRVGDAGFTVFGPKTDAPSPKIVANVGRGTVAAETTKANARLIAAAPDLLAAIEVAEGFVNYMADTGNDAAHAAHKMIVAAIAKARGDE